MSAKRIIKTYSNFYNILQELFISQHNRSFEAFNKILQTKEKEVINFNKDDIYINIIIPVFNRLEYLKKNIKCLLSQEYDKKYNKNDTPEETWEEIKLKEKSKIKNNGFYSILDDIPNNLPSLTKSIKVQSKASLLNFDWENYKGVLEKLDEELDELKLALKKQDKKNDIEEELGDLLFTTVSLARHLKLNPESVLNKSIKKFKNRFLYVEKKIYDNKINTKNNKNALNKFWNEAKIK